MCSPVLNTNLARWFVAGFLSIAAGCGGGTTGTSPTGSFELVGLVRSSSGAPIGDAEMTVQSSGDTQQIVLARTDSEGTFSMELSPAVTSLTATVGDKTSSEIARTLPGSSILSTELVEGNAGLYVDRNSFEVQVNESALCSALRLDGNTIYRQEELSSDSSCIIPFLIASKTLSTSRFRATIADGCEVTDKNRITVRPDKEGNLSLDVGPLLSSGCSSFSIVVSHDDTIQPGARFSVYG